MSAKVDTNRAWTRARRQYRSERFQRAYVAGARAAMLGLPVDACPYRARGGWAAWRTAWVGGFHSVAPISSE